METVLCQGAEAIITRKDKLIFKTRVAKSYREKELDDKLRKSRTRKERKALEKLSTMEVRVPSLHESPDEFTLVMDYIDGDRLRDVATDTREEVLAYFKTLGTWVGKMHNETLIHGDLTTSNALVSQKNLYLIDFGLSFFSTKIEDKAVDVHVFEEALESTHHQEKDHFFKSFLEGYSSCEDKEEVLKRLEQVRLRGRNKH